MKKTYKGSCHCGRVSYEVELDLSRGTGRCNCSYCLKVRNWTAIAKPAAFRLLTGEKDLGAYGFRPEGANHHMFCKNCGIHTFTRGHVEEIGGDYVSISLTTLDNAEPRELAEAPVRFMDGRNDNWFSEPGETRHL